MKSSDKEELIFLSELFDIRCKRQLTGISFVEEICR